jgi:hypothetical protein
MTDSFMRNKRFFISSQAFIGVDGCEVIVGTGVATAAAAVVVVDEGPNMRCPIPNPIPDPIPEVTEFTNP